MTYSIRLLLLAITLQTLVGTAHAAEAVRSDVKQNTNTENLPPLPDAVTSFGAAVVGDTLYVYGGHTGGAHAYSHDKQAKTLLCLNLNAPKSWSDSGEGPGLQGLALVAHGGKLYRLGGFTAKNAAGEEHNLWSQDEVASYDPSTQSWKSLPPLPEPRSSFDAAVLGDKIYVIGGWQLRGEEESIWHKTAYELDLSAASPEWKAIAEAPFQRRALSVAAHDGKIYAIGGMQQEGGITTRVDVYDPTSGTWSVAPKLHGKGMDGFGSSAFAVGGRLYVSTLGGTLQRLAADGRAWEIVQELEPGRFFHRMLPWRNDRLLLIGGANMSIGKFDDIEVIEVK